MNVLSILSWVLAALFGVPLAIFTIECLAGLARPRKQELPARLPRVALLIPAHDEEAGIGATVAALIAVAPAGTRILVVADNCSDATAVRARAAGAEVAERHDATKRGKGYALAFGQQVLAADPPDVVVVVDADCRLAPGSIAALGAVAASTERPAQAVNLLEPDPDATPLVQISSFAFLVKNLIRARGIARMGGATLLTGTGMAFPWSIFSTARLATGNIVEDLGLGIELTCEGRGPVLVNAARVTSPPAHQADQLGQRVRWEGGFLSTARTHALPTIAAGLRKGIAAPVLLGLHLLVPPLALLLVLGGVGLGLCLLLAVFGASVVPAMVLAAALLAAGMMVLIIWVREGRGTLSGAALLRAPVYVLWKLPVYARLLTGGNLGWNRTQRR